ncbi:hypothetical protein [Chrysiogenes arsenatis]|uniref:hypothetical protein n=1 Tax=Chrysiogenes arsenatis TaxID=309797 RepID=UPI000426B2BB|nr:hypothetical protein [Chrysiogenes arsenatis]
MAQRRKPEAAIDSVEVEREQVVESANFHERQVAMHTAELEAEHDARLRQREEQVEREQKIAECHEMIGRIQGVKMIADFANVGGLMWLKQVKETKLYRDLPSIGTWDKFCNHIGLSRQKVDEDLLNLATFGEQFLANVGGFQVGYRDLKKLRQLSAAGEVQVQDEVVMIGDEQIPLDSDHADDLRAGIERILEQNRNQAEQLARLQKSVDAAVKEETKGLQGEVKALINEVKRLKPYDPDEQAKDYSFAVEMFRSLQECCASLAAKAGKLMVDERVLDDPVLMGRIEGHIATAELVVRDVRRMWEERVNLFDEV